MQCILMEMNAYSPNICGELQPLSVSPISYMGVFIEMDVACFSVPLKPPKSKYLKNDEPHTLQYPTHPQLLQHQAETGTATCRTGEHSGLALALEKRAWNGNKVEVSHNQNPALKWSTQSRVKT